MASNRWVGAAQAIAQVDTRTLATPSIGSTYSVSCNNKTFTYTAASVTAATEAAAFVAAFNGQSGIGEFADTLASISSGAIILFTARNAGQPFSYTYAAGGVGAPTFAGSTTTTSDGPNDNDIAANYSTNALPANTNDLFFDQSAIDNLWNLSALSGVSLNSLTFTSTFTGDCGLPEINTGSSFPYVEYRQRYLMYTLAGGNPVLNVGDGDGQGSGRLYVDLQASAAVVNVRGTGSGADQNVEAMLLKGSALVSVNVAGGEVGCAIYGTETSSITTLNVGNAGGASNVRFRGGIGLTLTTLNCVAGNVLLINSPTTVKQQGGTITLTKGNSTTITLDAGTLYFKGDGSAATITTMSIGSQGILDLSQGNGTVTITNLLNMDAGARIIDPKSRLVLSAGFKVVRNNLPSGNFDFGPDRTYTVS